MRPNFQMRDKNKKIVYDSKDYVYRSEEKEPDKITDEIAFEITTRKFKEMGFEGMSVGCRTSPKRIRKFLTK